MKKFKNTIIIFCLFLVLWLLNFNPSRASSYDEIPPTIGKIEVSKSEVFAPDIIQIKISGIKEDGSGITNIHGHFYTFSRGKSYPISFWESYHDKPLFTGDTCTINVQVPSDVATWDYYLPLITVDDANHNSNTYYYISNGNWSEVVAGKYHLKNDNNKCQIENGYIMVYGEEYDLAVSNSNTNIGRLISNLEDGKVTKIYTTNSNTVVPKAAFDAIKGTNKKLSISFTDGVKWLFDGKDITGPTKAVDCKVDINTVQNEAYGTNNKLMKLDFKENGNLPGKAKIKLKSNYLSTLYNLDKKLYLYYLGDQQLTLEDDDVKTLKIGEDLWCEYEITHNSSFLLSQNKLTYQKPYIKLNTKTLTMQRGQKTSGLKVIGRLSSDNIRSWKSSNKRIVTVSNKGRLTAKKAGRATITVSLNSGVKAKCTVKVQNRKVSTRSIKVDKTRITLRKGKSYKLKVTRVPVTANDSKIKYRSSKTKIVTVSSKGLLKAKRKGKSTIVISAGKKSRKVRVTVK